MNWTHPPAFQLPPRGPRIRAVRERVDGGPLTVVREVVLTRKWECDECRRVISKGSAARVHITASQGRNRVYHVACDPKG